jgi:hypothetical protein
MKAPGYNDSVFINCPFDDEYKPILWAVIYTVYRCGFYPMTALDEDDGTDYRLDKIVRMIKMCRYGIHDLSRIEVNVNGYPRFNMPFELGVFFGAKRLGGAEHRTKNAMVLENVKYSAQQMISDLNGVDPRAHNNDPYTAMQKVREWLRTSSKRRTIPVYQTLKQQYDRFLQSLPAIAVEVGCAPNELPYSDLVNIIEDVVGKQIKA